MSGASTLRNFRIFKFPNCSVFLAIFCCYFRYFVGTNDMLVGLHAPTVRHLLPNVPTKLRKLGGGGGATTMETRTSILYDNVYVHVRANHRILCNKSY